MRGKATFHVHKVIIAAKSEFLEACVKGRFREGLENEVVVQETTPLAMASLLYYIYSGSYSLDKVAQVWPELKPTVSVLCQNAAPIKRKRTDEVEESAQHEESVAKTETRKEYPRKMQLEELRCHMRLYELADRFMMLVLRQEAVRSVMDMLHGNCGALPWPRNKSGDME
jgi:hypothetical protein